MESSTNWIKTVLTFSDRGSRQAVSAHRTIRRSVDDTAKAAARSSSTQRTSNDRAARSHETMARRVVTAHRAMRREAEGSRKELRRFGIEQTTAGRASRAFYNHLNNTNFQLTRLRMNVRNLMFPAAVGGLTALGQAAGAAAGGAASLVASLKPLLGLSGTLPAGILGIAQAVGTLKAALTPVGEAIKEVFNAQKSAFTGAASEAKKLLTASRAIRDAREAMADAARGVADAERNVAAASREAEDAQRSLNEAVADGRRELVDLQNQAVSAALAQRGAALSLQEAKKQLHETELDPTKSMLELKQAQLAVAQAKQGAKEAAIEARRAKQDSRDAESGGVGGLPQVEAARRGLADANRQAEDAARGLDDAERDLAKAARGVKEAQEDATEATEGMTSAQANLAYAMQQLDPVGRRFVRFLASLKPQFQELQKLSQRGIFPGAETGIRSAMRNFPVLQRVIGSTSRMFGGLAERAGQMIGSRGFGRDVEAIADTNTRSMTRLGTAGIKVARAFVEVGAAARPLVRWLSNTVAGWAETWAQTIRVERSTGRLRKKFGETRGTVERLTSIFSNLWTGFGNIIDRAKPLGDAIFAAIDRSAKRFRDWTESASGQNRIANYFEKIKAPLFEAGRLAGAFTRTLFRMGETPGLAGLIKQVRVELLPTIELLSTEFGQTFGKSLIELISSSLKLLEAMGHPLSMFLSTTAKITSFLASAINSVPGLKQFLGVIVSIGLASRAISFASAVTGISGLIGGLRRLKEADALGAAGGKGGSRLKTTVAGAAASTMPLGSSPSRPMWVREALSGPVGGVRGGKGAPRATTVASGPLSRREAIERYGPYAGSRYAANRGMTPTMGERFRESRAGRGLSRVGGAFRGPKVAGVAAVGATAAVIGGSMLPGKAGEAVTNIAGGAAAGMMFGPWGAAAGAAIGAILTFKDELKVAIEWVVDFVKKHGLIVAAGLTVMFGGLPLLVYAVVKFRKQIIGALGAAFEWIKTAAGDTLEFVKALPNKISSFFSELPGKIMQAVRDLPATLGKIAAFWATLPIRVGVFMLRLRLKVLGILLDLAPKAAALGWKVIKFLANAWWKGWSTLAKFWLSLPGRVIGAVSDLAPKAFRFGVKTIGRLLGGMKDKAIDLLGWVGGLPNKIVEAVGKLAQKIYNAGKDFAKNFAKGIYDNLPGPVRDAISWTAGAGSDVFGALNPFDDGGGGDDGGSKPAAPAPRAAPAGPKRLPQIGPDQLQIPDDTKKHKKTQNLWSETTSRVGKAADDMKKKVDDSFKRQAKAAGDSTSRVRKKTSDDYGAAAKNASSAAKRMQGDSDKAFRTMAGTAGEQTRKLAGSVRTSMGQAAGATYTGMDYIVGTMNQSLKAFDAQPVTIKVSPPKLPKRAGGGWVGNAGERGRDDQLVLMGRGEAVLNHPQQRVVTESLMATHGTDLDGLFSAVNSPHSGFGFSRGGRMPTFSSGGILGTDPKIKAPKVRLASGKFHNTSDVMGSRPGFIPFMNYLSQFEPAVTVISGYRPGSITTSGNVSNHASGHAVDISNPGIVGATSAATLNATGSWATRQDKVYSIIKSRFGNLPGDFLWRTDTGGNHWNHIHRGITSVEADSAAAMQAYISKLPQGGAFGKIPPPRMTGTAGPPLTVAKAAVGLGTQAANAYVSSKMRFRNAGGIAPPSDARLRSLNHTYPKHSLYETGGKTRFSPKLIERIAAWAGLPPKLFMQIAKGESGFYPGIYGVDPGGTTGYGLWAITTSFNDARVRKYGGYEQMLNPLKNAKVAKEIYDERGDYSAWYGTKYVTAARGGRGGPIDSRNLKKRKGNAQRPNKAPFGPRFDSKSPSRLARLARGGRALRRFATGGGWAPWSGKTKKGVPAITRGPEPYRPTASVIGLPGRPTLDTYGFDPVPKFGFERVDRQPFKKGMAAAKAAVAALDMNFAEQFREFGEQLLRMNFSSLKEAIEALGEQIKGAYREVRAAAQKLATTKRDAEKDDPKTKDKDESKVTKAENKAIKAAEKGVEKAREQAQQIKAKRQQAYRVMRPMRRFQNKLDRMDLATVGGVRDQMKENIEGFRKRAAKGGWSKAERTKLKRMTSLYQQAADEFQERVRDMMQYATDQLAAATHATNMSELGLQNLVLKQQLAGTADTAQGKAEQAAYISANILPNLQSEQAALEYQLGIARQSGNVELARQIAEEIAAKQNGILQAQLEVQELTKAEMEDMNDAITGSLGFSFNSQTFTDILGLGVGT